MVHRVNPSMLLGLWVALCAIPVERARGDAVLTTRNLQAPFPYVHGRVRSWPILTRDLAPGAVVELTARDQGQIIAQGESLDFWGYNVSLSLDGMLQVASHPVSPEIAFDLEVRVTEPGELPVWQELEVRPAPANRPLSYIADTSDDFYYNFPDDWVNGDWVIDKGGFDQWFRRMQAQGVTRLVLSLTPAPFVADEANYAPADWDRMEKQSRAIMEHPVTQAGDWSLRRRFLSPRLQPDFGAKLSQSAIDHSIALSVSYHPFEQALTKYHGVPTFDSNGNYLWDFLPMASPVVNCHPEDVGWSHYRTLLADLGHADQGRLDTIEVTNVQNTTVFLQRWASSGDNLKIVASDFPPLQEDSYVLHQQTDGSFDLVAYQTIQALVESQLHVVTGYNVVQGPAGSVLITGLNIPDQYRYILLSNPAQASEALNFHTFQPVILWSQAGNLLGRENVYWVLDDTPDHHKQTRVGGITADGDYHTEFNATESSINALLGGSARRNLFDEILVIDQGMQWSVEMVDFNQQAARDFVTAELATILAYPAFDEIFINTRTHTDLAGYMADSYQGAGLGIKPLATYLAWGSSYTRLGVHLAYIPQSGTGNANILEVVADPPSIGKITTWQPDEFQYHIPCQSPDSPYDWRLARNQEVASGIRSLLVDLEQALPGVPIRVVIPEREAATLAVRAGLATMPKPGGGVYGSNYYGAIWASNNHSLMTGEGIAMVDLTGLSAEPVFSGIRFLPDQGPLSLYVDECVADLADNRGSSFQGPRTFFYEINDFIGGGFQTHQVRHEEIMCYLLSQTDDIDEVIMYEAAAWATFESMDDPAYFGRDYLDVCLGTAPGSVADLDVDGDVDMTDFGLLQACLAGSGVLPTMPGCSISSLDGDFDLDQDDVDVLQQCMSGANVPADPDCAD